MQYTPPRPEQSRRQKNPMTAGTGASRRFSHDHMFWLTYYECGISARFARLYVLFRIWVTGRPVFRRKGHVPEHRIGQHELYSHLRMIALMPVNVCDNTLQCSFCLDVRESESLSSVLCLSKISKCLSALGVSFPT